MLKATAADLLSGSISRTGSKKASEQGVHRASCGSQTIGRSGRAGDVDHPGDAILQHRLFLLLPAAADLARANARSDVATVVRQGVRESRTAKRADGAMARGRAAGRRYRLLPARLQA